MLKVEGCCKKLVIVLSEEEIIMLRIDYTNLTKKQVEEVLAKSTPPACAAKLCSRLAGKTLKIILDKLPVEGPVLEYAFQSDVRLTLKENGGATVECDYGALSLKDVTLFSHMIPGTKRGFTVIVNWETTVVTAFEMWFIDHEGTIVDTTKELYDYIDAIKLGAFVNREVQRQYYFGYFETPGKEPPAKRDELSLRLENCMINWKEDRGENRLTTYTSSTFSTIVELDTPDGGDVLTFVSDILQINEHTFIYCYGEVEFSGRLGVEVIDLFTTKKIGVSMGIDEEDRFEHTLYTGCGKNLGRFATFYDFNDKGNQYSDFVTGRFDFSVKGARSTYRPSIMTKKITEEGLLEAGKKPLLFAEPEQNIMFCDQALTETDYCVGKELAFRGDDGYAVQYRFPTGLELEYRFEGEADWHKEEYRATMLDDELVILGHYRTGSNPPGCHVLALDFKNGLATCIDARFGNKYDLHDISPNYHFGIMETDGVVPLRIFRHGFTDELLGRAFTWTYSNQMSSIHIYNAPRSYSWTIIANSEPGTPGNRAGGPVWSSPCEYIKLRDDVYIMNWVEHKWEGLMGCACMNLRIMHDCGFTFGISHEGTDIFLDTLGALCRSAGKVDLSGIYPLRSYDTRA